MAEEPSRPNNGDLDCYIVTPNLNVNVPVISGREFARLDWTKSERAAFAAMVVLGERELDDLTREQICKVFRRLSRLLDQGARALAATREAVAAGEMPLSEDIPVIPTNKTLRKTMCAMPAWLACGASWNR